MIKKFLDAKGSLLQNLNLTWDLPQIKYWKRTADTWSSSFRRTPSWNPLAFLRLLRTPSSLHYHNNKHPEATRWNRIASPGSRQRLIGGKPLQRGFYWPPMQKQRFPRLPQTQPFREHTLVIFSLKAACSLFSWTVICLI